MPNSTLVRRALISAILTVGVLAALPRAFAAENASAANGELVVHVVDASGSPRAGAAVTLFTRDNVSRLLTDKGREIKSDASGRAVFDHLATDQFYFLRASAGNYLLGYRGTRINFDKPTQELQLMVSEPRSATVHVHDEQGKPIAGATVSRISGTNAKAWFWLDWPDLPKVGIIARPSNAAGELTVEGLPEGELSLELCHPKFALATLAHLATTRGSPNDIAMSPGAVVVLRFRLPRGISQVENLKLNWAQDITASESLPPVLAGKPTELVLKPGKYADIYVQHPDFVVTPEYLKRGKRLELHGGENVFTFDVRAKTKVRGRVIDQTTGKPHEGIDVAAFAVADKTDGPFADFVWPWTLADESTTNRRGEYELRAPAGSAIVTIEEDEGLISQHDGEKVNVSADGSTAVPDILVRPIPEIRGIVRGPDGRPVPWAVVRFRDSVLIYRPNHPAVADADGRFELSAARIPTDHAGGHFEMVQTILAFDPYRPLGTIARVNLADAKSIEHVELRLQRQDYGFAVTGFPGEDSAVGVLPSTEWRAKEAKWARGGDLAPELDGVAWLNTAEPKMSLADFRGKFVLLHFWTTWCGNCPNDLPNLAAAEKLYKSKGLAVICVHDNSIPIAEIKKYVADHKLRDPVVIDQPDGRVLAAYKPHGAIGYPTDVLVGPDGRIVGHPPDKDRVTFRLELLRQELMSQVAGIGVALKIEDGKVLVNSLLPGAAAARSGALHPNDRIVAVGEVDGEQKNLTGLDIRQAVKLIRGRPGTLVRLTIIPAGKNESAAQVVSLERGDVSFAGGIRLNDGKLVLPGTIAPNFSFTRMDGSQADLISLRGKIVVLETWASWCKPCVESVGRMQSLRAEHVEWKGQVEILFTSIDDLRENAVKCAKAQSWTAIPPVWSGPELANDYCTSGVPATFIIDREGRVVAAGKPGSDFDIAKTLEEKHLLVSKSH